MAVRQKKKWAVVNLTMFPYHIMVSVGETDEEFSKRMLRYESMNHEKIAALCHLNKLTNQGTTMMFEDGVAVVRVLRLTNKSKQHAILAHELFHAVTLVLHRAGVDFQMDVSDEVYAYGIGHITEQVYDKIKM